jgi:hypothetical protein
MEKLRRDLEFAQESIDGERCRQVGAQHLHGDLPAVLRIGRQEHSRHSARSNGRAAFFSR